MPKISVIIPSYNCEKYISESVNSALKQAYPEFEILIIDDGSIDNTGKIAKEYANKNPNKIKYFYQHNQGVSAARNKGIELSKGDYIAFLDGDDIWVPEKLEKSVQFLEKYNFDWIATSFIRITKAGDKAMRRLPKDSYIPNEEANEIHQLKNGISYYPDSLIHTSTIVAKKMCFKKAGLFAEDLLIGEDTDLFLRFEETGLRGGYLDEPLSIYRYNSNGMMKSGKIDVLREFVKLAQKHVKILGAEKPIIRKSYSQFLWNISRDYYIRKQIFRTLQYALLSNYYDFCASKVLKILKYGMKKPI